MIRRLALLAVLALAGIVVVSPSATAGGMCHMGLTHEMTSSERTTVGIGECAFLDTVTYIEPGEEVTWVNKDPVPHTVSGAGFSWGSERMLDQGERVSYTFNKEGVYPYYCALHPSMVGAVVVGDARPAALSNGAADVTENRPASGGAAVDAETEPAAAETDVAASAAVGVAILLTLAVVFVASRLFFRRRAASATPVR